MAEKRTITERLIGNIGITDKLSEEEKASIRNRMVIVASIVGALFQAANFIYNIIK